jgi:hypothetical protein
MSTFKTLAIIVKDKLINMPENMDDKEIVNYVKESIKEAKVELKSKKTLKNKNTDEEKPKYSLSAYQEFMKEQQVIFKEKYPELSSKERLGKIAEEWNKTKENKILKNTSFVKEVDDVNEVKEVNEDKEDKEEDKVENNVEDVVVKKKPSKKK